MEAPFNELLGTFRSREKYLCEAASPQAASGCHTQWQRNHLIRYQPEEPGAIYAFKESGELIGEIPLAQKLNAHFYADEAQVAVHKSAQNHQLRQQRETLEAMRVPFDQRPENANATPRLVGGVELTLGKAPERKVVSLPLDEKLGAAARAQAEQERVVKADFLDKRGQAVFDKLNKLG